jgi:uncharacterized protein
MRYLNFIIFFILFIGIYFAGNYYVYIRGIQSLPSIAWIKTSYRIVFPLLAISFIASRFIGRIQLVFLDHVLNWAGAFWLVALIYFLFALVIVDLARLVNLWGHFLPLPGSYEYDKLKMIALITTILVVLILVLYGHLNAIHPRIKRINVDIAKLAHGRKEIKIVAASDLHLGPLIGKKRLEKLVSIANAEKPDIILLAGDLLDESQATIFRENTGEPLKNLKAPMGVYAILGNHEYIGGVQNSIKYIESLNIKIIRDSSVTIDSSLVLIGRDDYSSGRFSKKGRKALNELVAGVDATLPLVLLDHQPFHLKEAEDNGIDFQISGHTHDGQLWPFNYITRAMYEVSHGYLKKGNTHYYVSSGFGSWGPPVRIGTDSEILVITLILTEN